MFYIITMIAKLTILVAWCNVGVPASKLPWTLCPVELNIQKEKTNLKNLRGKLKRLVLQPRVCKDPLSKAEHLRAIKEVIVKIYMYKILISLQKMFKTKSKNKC